MMRESFFDKLSQSSIPANKHNYCFLMGDLNLGMWMEIQRKDIERSLLCGKLEKLLSFDQLNMERYWRRSFDEFEEMRITWGPSYRFSVGSHVFDTSHKMQLPAYYDIVLFHRNDPTQVPTLKNQLPLIQQSLILSLNQSNRLGTAVQSTVSFAIKQSSSRQIIPTTVKFVYMKEVNPDKYILSAAGEFHVTSSLSAHLHLLHQKGQRRKREFKILDYVTTLVQHFIVLQINNQITYNQL
ncbi:MAG: hypothetical protein EZS28_015393 [Streblomastix strix]|uniref:Inositol polyphosphate-related phosphatase domain-containing protein n=1 Tax=Streblomastix strix TaxID=222440 RepID=A0A5J4W347_9EUKA|nr:MAG: hypothetical protein EZS28_015393 [Streblomastix strix]